MQPGIAGLIAMLWLYGVVWQPVMQDSVDSAELCGPGAAAEQLLLARQPECGIGVNDVYKPGRWACSIQWCAALR
jgi:hypothetical protein